MKNSVVVELGKYYKSRNGFVFGPMQSRNSETYPFKAQELREPQQEGCHCVYTADPSIFYNWDKNGSFTSNLSIEHPLDLIKEVPSFMTTPEITVGEWETRDGQHAVVLTTTAPNRRPVAGYIIRENGANSEFVQWYLNGTYHGCHRPCGLDLHRPFVVVPPKPQKQVAEFVYLDRYGKVYAYGRLTTRDEALAWCKENEMTLIDWPYGKVIVIDA